VVTGLTTKRTVWLWVVLGLACLWTWVRLTCYPSRDEVGRTISQIPSLDPAARKRSLVTLLGRLRPTNDRFDDEVMGFAFSELGRLYRSARYPEILEALDESQADGGFANELCSFYGKVRDLEEFRRRYRSRARALERCVGISFSPGDLKQLRDERPAPN